MNEGITMWSAGVRLFGKNKRPIEDMTIENFPATSKANAHSFAVQKGMEHLRELGYDQDHGAQIIFIEEHTPGKSKSTTALAIVDSGKSRKNNNFNNKPRVKYKPFSCPISTLCSSQYLGVKENGVFNVVNKPEET